MKELIKKLYKDLYKEDLVVQIPCPVKPKTNNEKLLELALTYFNTDPTPKDEHPDEVACVHSLTTILKKMYLDFPIMTYTPLLLGKLQSYLRFKVSNEFKEGNIIVSPTNTGNGSIIGHCGVLSKNGKILSNSSATGLWTDKYDNISWIDRYSRKGGLSLYIFELV